MKKGDRSARVPPQGQGPDNGDPMDRGKGLVTSRPKACRISASDSRHAATSMVRVVLGMISVFMVL